MHGEKEKYVQTSVDKPEEKILLGCYCVGGLTEFLTS
jgi:hypothetical protein